MYKIYTSNYQPFWLNSENKPSYQLFNSINFDWKELNNSGVNYNCETTITFTVNNLKDIYFKIVEIDETTNNIVSTNYFYFKNVVKRLNKGYIISAEIDTWTTFNISVEKNFVENNKVVKFRRGHLKLQDYPQYPVSIDSLLNSVNDFKSKNTPMYTTWDQEFLGGGGFYFFGGQNGNVWQKDSDFSSGSLRVDFKNFSTNSYIFNKYFVVDNEGEYLLFPDFSPDITIKNDSVVEMQKEGIVWDRPTNAAVTQYTKNLSTNKLTVTGSEYHGQQNEINLIRLHAIKNSGDEITIFPKLNTKSDMDYLINKSKFAAKKESGLYYGPDISTLTHTLKFSLNWGVYYESQKDGTNTRWGRTWLFFRLPFFGKKANNLFYIPNDHWQKTIVTNMNSASYLTNGEQDIYIGNTVLKYKQLINKNYLLRFDNSGFKLFPTNQTNIELFNVISYGDLLPTQKDSYLQYVASVRNSVNTGYWTNYAQKHFSLGQKAISGLVNSSIGAGTTIFNTVSNAVSTEFNNSLLIANIKAKFADMKNSFGLVPQTTNVDTLNFYLVPQNWLFNNKQKPDIQGKVVSYQYSIMEWLTPTLVDINNLFLFYGFELNNSYPFNSVYNQEIFYFAQLDSEYLAREINYLYPLNVDYKLKLLAMNEWTSGVRIFKKLPSEENTKWTI